MNSFKYKATHRKSQGFSTEEGPSCAAAQCSVTAVACSERRDPVLAEQRRKKQFMQER
jgi:hypothetical protein